MRGDRSMFDVERSPHFYLTCGMKISQIPSFFLFWIDQI
jgi:hypothetical protein